MNKDQKHDQEQLEHDQHLADLVEEATPTEVKPLISEPIAEATIPTEVKPLISESIEEAMPTEVKPFILEPIAPLQSRPQIGLRRRTLLIGGAIAFAVVGGGAFAITFIRQTFLNPSAALSVHFTHGQPILRLTGHTSPVTSVAWSPDGRYLVSATNDPFAMLWDITPFLHRSSASLQTIDQSMSKWSSLSNGLSTDQLYWTPDGRYLLTTISDTSFDTIPALLDPFTSTSKPRTFSNPNIKHPYFRSAVVSPQGSTVAAVDGTLHRYHKIDLWQFQTLTQPYASLTYADADQFIGDSSAMEVIDWSSDSEQLAGLTNHNEVVIWGIKSRTVNAVVKLPERVKAGTFARMFSITLSWSPGNPHLLAVSNFDTIAVIDAQQKKVLYQLSTDDKGALNSTADPEDPSIIYPHVLGIAWSPDGRYIAGSYARSPKVFVWDLQAKNARTEQGLMLQSSLFPPDDSTDQTDTINSLSWSPSGRYLATASSDQSITIWQVES